MAKQKRQNPMEREKNRKNGSISPLQLYSCYAASAVIAVLCVLEAMKPETVNPGMYYLLGVVGVGYSVYITLRNQAAKKSGEPKGRRLK